ncbi:hypothetical protein QM467_00585 [Rhodoblastus sp. 17X3]|uniref:hypothetical protein n=1 Tax=Rhodoblastus sp. 17X3 TaxID=3047026 RepID=UPI0024B7E926|nr:hypothetical protein [Rhodoblastus sp. 17X3]MDI9846547.1 hypothetical protein [Rhodoblastus sp. 17X3]
MAYPNDEHLADAFRRLEMPIFNALNMSVLLTQFAEDQVRHVAEDVGGDGDRKIVISSEFLKVLMFSINHVEDLIREAHTQYHKAYDDAVAVAPLSKEKSTPTLSPS